MVSLQTNLIHKYDQNHLIFDDKLNWTKGIKLSTHAEVGEAYFDYMKHILAEPYILGWHLCGYIEGWDGLDSGDEDPSLCRQCCLINPFEEEHSDTIEKVRIANGYTEVWHSSNRGVGNSL